MKGREGQRERVRERGGNWQKEVDRGMSWQDHDSGAMGQDDGSPLAVAMADDDVGKSVKESKKRVTWQFCFENNPSTNTVVLTHSIVSGKRKIEFNGRVIFEQKDLADRVKEMFQFDRKGLYDHAWNSRGHLLRVNVEERVDGFLYDLFV